MARSIPTEFALHLCAIEAKRFLGVGVGQAAPREKCPGQLITINSKARAANKHQTNKRSVAVFDWSRCGDVIISPCSKASWRATRNRTASSNLTI
jgi:hypothetical protein